MALNSVVGVLTDLGAPRVIRLAAVLERIAVVECAMPDCLCPRGRRHFEARGTRSPWAPSADRWPLAGRDGGTYDPANVRLAHARCNESDGGRAGNALRKANGGYDSPEHRERGRQLSSRGLPALRAWEQTAEGHEVRVANGDKLATWNALHPAARAAAASFAGTVSNCLRWNVNRGKACICGRH